jgi:hypothetical protein
MTYKRESTGKARRSWKAANRQRKGTTAYEWERRTGKGEVRVEVEGKGVGGEVLAGFATLCREALECA